MDVRTYRAATMQEALALVRRELGPAAAVLHTREIPPKGWRRLVSGRGEIEITASTQVNVPSRLPPQEPHPAPPGVGHAPTPDARPAGPKDRDDLKSQLDELQAMVEDLCRRQQRSGHEDVPEELFHVFTDLIDADLSEELAREFVGRLRDQSEPAELQDRHLAKRRIAAMIEAEIRASGPIRVGSGQRRVVALVGPTGVGKTTTIAKLAANFRLRAKHNVGLITVDTYRIAAVEQLRTYADIIDLPMAVVSTPREMREAAQQFAHLDLVLIDTAGRSPRDDVKIQELRAFLSEAQADEVHLVLSSGAGASTLVRTAEKFAEAGTTALIFTKLDEAGSLGNLLPVLRSSPLPLSYLTDGQNVPDDIEAADASRLARLMLGLDRE